MQKHRVGICIPNYNMSATLAKTLQSAIDQIYVNCTIYIADNCSTDNSWELIQKFQQQHQNIVAIQNKHHVSMEENWNIVLRLAEQEDYVNILSADDVLEPSYVNECVALHKKSTEPLGYVYSERYHLSDTQEVSIIPFFKNSGIIHNLEALRINLEGFHTAPCQLLINNDALKSVGYLSTKFGPASEMHLTLKINAKYKIAYINKALVGYNISSGMSASNKMTRLLATLFHKLKNDIIDNHLPKELASKKVQLSKSIDIFCARYCLANSICALKSNNLQETKELILLASSFDLNISDSTVLQYILNNDEYILEILQKHINELYPRNNLKQPYSLPHDSISMENFSV